MKEHDLFKDLDIPHLIYNSTSDYMGVIDVSDSGDSFTFISVNQRILDRVSERGLTEENFIDVRLVDYLQEFQFMSLEEAQEIEEHYKTVCATKKPFVFETSFDMGEGVTLYTENTLHPIFRDGTVRFVMFAAKDITEKKLIEVESTKKAQESIRRAVRENEMIANALIAGQEQERGRIAKELHDGVGQLLSVIKRNITSHLDMPGASEEEKQGCANILALVDDSIGEIREISNNLMPSILVDFGLVAAIKNMVDRSNDTRITLQVEESVEKHLNQEEQVHVFRIVQESVNNALKYSEATAIDCKLIMDGETIVGEINDNGKGIGTKMGNGQGIFNMRQRTRLMNATLQIKSEQGTQVKFVK